MINTLRKYIPDFDFLNRQDICDSYGLLGYHVQLVSKNGVVGGGTGNTLEVATQIAIAEALERRVFLKLFNSNDRKYLVDIYPTSCGFAAGFDEKSVKFRSICEAVERWAWEQWIDKNHNLKKIVPSSITPLAKYFLSKFDGYTFLYRDIPLKLEEQIFPLRLMVFLGFKNGGVFPGSRVTVAGDDMFTHPVVEAFRHLDIYENTLSKREAKDIVELRIKYFGENGDDIQKNINLPDVKNWQVPELLFCEKIHSEDFFVYRSLCKNFWGWHQGHVNRFIY